MSPFIRARVPELERQSGLSASELLAFIDGLNEAFMANPVLQATSTIGTIVGFVPLASTQVVGGGLQLAAGLGAAGVSIARTKAYMKRANEDIFKPRGLHAQIVKTEKMLGLVGMAGDCDAFIQHQHEAMVDNARMRNGNGNPIARRMDALGDRVMELSFDSVNAPVAPENWMKKLGLYQAQRAEKKQLAKLDKRQAKMERRSAKSERKLNRGERKQDEAQETMEDMDEIRIQLERLDPGQQGYAEIRRKLVKEHRQVRRDLRVADTNKHSRKTDNRDRKFEKRTQRRLDKQAKKTKKILWIVITTEEESPVSDSDWATDEDSDEDSVEGCGEKSHED